MSGVRLVDVLRRGQALCPRQRAVDLISLMEDVSGPHPVALDAEGDVGPQPDRHVGPGRVGGAAVVADHLPFGGNPAVVEVRLADQLHLDLALEAERGADQQMLPVLVGWRPGVGRDPILAAGRAHGQRVADQDPTRLGVPGGGQGVGPGLVVARDRVVDPERRETKGARLAVEQGAEDARRVEARHAEPVDRAVGSDEGAGVTVGEERVLGDRRERRGRGGALGGGPVTHDATHGPCQPPKSATSLSAAFGPQEPGLYGWTGVGLSSRG